MVNPLPSRDDLIGRSTINTITTLEHQLNDFDLTTRTNALAELVALAERGEAPCEPVQDVVNLHCHTFFSFNAYGHSPTSLAWLAKKRGFAAVGIVDFDVLDAVDEFLAACDLAGVRGSAGIETRVFIPEFATREINSPGEPGVYYHMGIGFTSGTVPPEAAPTLASMRARAERRNREMVGAGERLPRSGDHRLRSRRPAADPRGQRHRAPHAPRVHPRGRSDLRRCGRARRSPSGPRSSALRPIRSRPSSATMPNSPTWCAAS